MLDLHGMLEFKLCCNFIAPEHDRYRELVSECQLPECQLPKYQLPKRQLLKISTPKMPTPKMSTSQNLK